MRKTVGGVGKSVVWELLVRSLLIGRRKQWHVILAIVLVLFGVRVRHHWWLLLLEAATWPREMSPFFSGVTKPPPEVNVVFLGSSPFLIWRCHKQTSINKLYQFKMLYLVHWSWILENVFTSVSDSTLTYFKSFPLKCKRFCTQIKVTVQ